MTKLVAKYLQKNNIILEQYTFMRHRDHGLASQSDTPQANVGQMALLSAFNGQRGHKESYLDEQSEDNLAEIDDL